MIVEMIYVHCCRPFYWPSAVKNGDDFHFFRDLLI